MNVRKTFKWKDEHNYIYVGDNNGPRRTYRPQVDFSVNYVGDVVQVEDLLDSFYVTGACQMWFQWVKTLWFHYVFGIFVHL